MTVPHWWAAVGAATTAAMATPTPTPEPPAVAPVLAVPEVQPGHIAAPPVTDPDLGAPHVQADPVRKPWDVPKTTVARIKEALEAIVLCKRMYPEAVAKSLVRDLEWMRASGWMGEQQRLQDLIDGVKADAANRGLDEPGAAA